MLTTFFCLCILYDKNLKHLSGNFPSVHLWHIRRRIFPSRNSYCREVELKIIEWKTNMAEVSEEKKKTHSIPGISMVRKRSSTVVDVVFTNRELFPSIIDMPDEDYPLRQYYRPTIMGPQFVPIRPWYFLGEITDHQYAASSFFRHRIRVTDIDGNEKINIDSYTKGPHLIIQQ